MGGQYADFVFKTTGVDLTKRKEPELAHINKGVGMNDPTWDAYLSAHAAAAAGDPAGMSRWASIEYRDPGVARLVPMLAEARRPRITKSKKRKRDAAADPSFEDFVASLGQTGGRAGELADDNTEFDDFVANLGRTSAANKSAGSQGARPSLAGLDSDPEFIAYRDQQRARLGIRG